MSDEARAHKAHRPSTAKGKVSSKGDGGGGSGSGQNPKAFAIFGKGKAERLARRTADLDQKKLHVPRVDRSGLDLPPIVVGVVGPRGVGKSALIKSLAKRFTKHSLSAVCGPITVVSGKTRRLTFIEADASLASMIDIAKVADLILLMIDASFGFEMEHFEFLNILQTHGMPKVMGVLTHLDKFKDNKRLKTRKKELKSRFWTEIYDGAKLFYLSGLVNGKYPKRDVLNLARFISIMKFRPLVWRNSHSYILADRVEDLTDPEVVELNPTADRQVALYGWLRGTNLKFGSRVHIPGAGDFTLSSISGLPDPCPLPASAQGKKLKRLDEKHKLIYAPMSDVSGVLYDKDAVYINIPKKASAAILEYDDNDDGVMDTDGLGEGERMLGELRERGETIADVRRRAEIQLFAGSKPLRVEKPDASDSDSDSDDLEGDEVSIGSDSDDDDDEDDVEGGQAEEEAEDDERVFMNTGRRRAFQNHATTSSHKTQNQEDVAFAESDSDLSGAEDEDHSDMESDDDNDQNDQVSSDDESSDQDSDNEDENVNGSLRWKNKMLERAKSNFLNARTRKINLMDFVYGENTQSLSQASPATLSTSNLDDQDKTVGAEDDDDDFFTVKRMDPLSSELNLRSLDSSKTVVSAQDLVIMGDEQVLSGLCRLFVTGPKDSELVTKDENAFGDFEDLETGEKFDGPAHKPTTTSDGDVEGEDEATRLDRRKEELKAKFDANYDTRGGGDDEDTSKNIFENTKNEFTRQAKVNRDEFQDDDENMRIQVEGFRAGQYVRVVVQTMPCEFMDHFDPNCPVIVGGLGVGEEGVGFVQVRVKRHRWHRKILKTNDPLIFSVGWRRFQSLPLYSMKDNGGIRNRLLKYTPEHMHCLATFYGPVTPPNTGFCAFQSLKSNTPNFRVCATGIILDIDQSSEIVKKLKLTGVPNKIYKNTAFVKDMFTSALEVAKFEGASIRTVSGIRGTIKKHAGKPDGCFRATFEDKILMSDIVFLRAWYPIKPKKFYSPMTTLLLKDKESWQGVRLTREIRQQKSLPVPREKDSDYKPIARVTRKFNTLKIPRALQASLPFASKPKHLAKRTKQTYLTQRAVVLEPEEKRVYTLLQQLNTIKRDKDVNRNAKQRERKALYIKKKEREESIQTKKQKEKLKEIFRTEGKKRAAAESKENAGRSKKRKT